MDSRCSEHTICTLAAVCQRPSKNECLGVSAYFPKSSSSVNETWLAYRNDCTEHMCWAEIEFILIELVAALIVPGLKNDSALFTIVQS